MRASPPHTRTCTHTAHPRYETYTTLHTHTHTHQIPGAGPNPHSQTHHTHISQVRHTHTHTHTHKVRVMPPREIPWFPLNIRDLDLTKDTLDAGACVRVCVLMMGVDGPCDRLTDRQTDWANLLSVKTQKTRKYFQNLLCVNKPYISKPRINKSHHLPLSPLYLSCVCVCVCLCVCVCVCVCLPRRQARS